jgi:hypothetical protein
MNSDRNPLSGHCGIQELWEIGVNNGTNVGSSDSMKVVGIRPPWQGSRTKAVSDLLLSIESGGPFIANGAAETMFPVARPDEASVAMGQVETPQSRPLKVLVTCLDQSRDVVRSCAVHASISRPQIEDHPTGWH